VIEQPALASQSAGVASERPAGADDAVTRHHDCDRVCAVRGADGAARRRTADACGDLPVTLRRSGRDRSDRSPHSPLERGAAGCDRHLVECSDIAVKIGVERPDD